MSKNQRTGLHGLAVLWVRTCEPCYCHVEHRIFSSGSHRALWPSTWNLAAFKLVVTPVAWPLSSRDEQRHLPSELSRSVKVLAIQWCLTLRPHGLWPSSFLCPWNSPGKNTRVGCPSLLQGIFPTQGSNLGLPHCWPALCHLSHHVTELKLNLGYSKLWDFQLGIVMA